MGPWYGSLASLKGSELWAPILKVVFPIRGIYQGVVGSTLEMVFQTGAGTPRPCKRQAAAEPFESSWLGSARAPSKTETSMNACCRPLS